MHDKQARDNRQWLSVCTQLNVATTPHASASQNAYFGIGSSINQSINQSKCPRTRHLL